MRTYKRTHFSNMVFQSQAEALSWNVSFYAITQIVINQGFKAIYSLLPDVR